MRWGSAVLTILTFVSCLSCSVNILENFADKTGDGALFNDAVAMINDGDYDGALAKIALMTSGYQGQREVVMLKASAYGGKCGIQYVPFVESLTNMGSTFILPFLMQQFTGATSASIDSCITAQNLVTSIGAVGIRTSDENMFLLVVAFAKIGNILAFYADTDGDDTVDASFTEAKVCTAGGVPPRVAGGTITNADTIEIGTGIALAVEQLTALSSTVNLGSASLTTISNTCGSLPINICTMTTNSSYTDGTTDVQEIQAVRTLVNEDHDVGIGTCAVASGDVAACVCL